ncbi:MAG: AEC family transporter [Candidatus Omnitrophota bacterium]|nr:AEC family transporter [Candidatus Omnitrophota bacterium]
MLEAFLTSFKSTSFAVFEILILGFIGFIILKRNIISPNGLDIISKLVVEVTLPLFVFTQLLLRFKFSLYPNWYVFPFISLVINFCGFIIGFILLKIGLKSLPQKREFLALSAFQNSGYLVIPLVATLLPKDRADELLIYLFLFLLGFNLLVWSFGVYLLSGHKRKGFELGSLFSPVVVAILLGLLFSGFGVGGYIPDMVVRPLKLIGECTIPLAMLVVGGSLALIDFSRAAMKISVLINILLAKLILVPALALFVIYKFKPQGLIGLLIIIEAAVPSATSLSLISRHYKAKDADFINQGIFWTHIFSIFTLPLFLSLFSVISNA